MRNIARSLSTLRKALASSLFLAAFMALFSGSASAQLLAAQPSELAAGPHTFTGHTPHMVAEGKATFVEHYDPTKMLRLTISLTLPHPVEESQFLVDLQDKKSPLYHQYLTPEQWDARFAPSAADEQAVIDWATSQGLTINARFPDRLMVEVEGTAGTIERALHVVLNTYQLPSDDIGIPGEKDFSNDRDPVLPSSLNPVVLSVMGLNSIERVRPASIPNSPKPPDYTPGPLKGEAVSTRADAESTQTVAQAITPETGAQGSNPSENNGYYPKDVWSSGAYDTNALMRQGHCCNPTDNPNNSPAQTSIALASYGDLNFNDIAGFHTGFPFLAYNLTKIPIDGGYTCDNTATSSDGNCVEVTLDAEWSLTMANSQGSSAATSKVYVYEGHSYEGSVTALYNQMATDNYARVTSTSWACEEVSCWSKADMTTVDGIFAKMVGQGWTILSASGDQGSTAGCGSTLALNFPPSDPNVIAIGGTTLYVYYDQDQFDSETDWVGGQTQDTSTSKGSCRSNGGGSTGGYSAYFGVPGYQSNMGVPSRANPDVSLNASVGQNLYFNGNWSGIGGTSMSSPMMAGFFAQANAYILSLGAVCNGAVCGSLGNVNYQLYELGNNHDAAHVPYYDTTVGCSSNDKTTEYNLTAFCSKTGFDETTGWGTINMLQMAWALNWRTVTTNGVPYTTFKGPATNAWYNSNQNVSWTIVDFLGTAGGQVTGIAGFTQGWDSISPDSFTQPHGSPDLSPDGFYDGPQFPNTSTGCLSLSTDGGCAGGVTQGCHTAHVRGWNNMGETTGDTTYGPVCYDTVSPTVSFSSSPSIVSGVYGNQSVTVTLAPNDPGGSGASGIAHTYYSVDSFSCQVGYQGNCSVYSGPIKITAQGAHTFTYFTLDNAGNYSALGTYYIYIDTTAPTTTLGLSGTLVGNYYESAVKVALTATDTGGSGLENTFYSIDGGGSTLYTGTFTVSTPGSHAVTYSSVDFAGNIESTHTNTFVIVSPTNTSMTVTSGSTAQGAPVTLTATVMPTLSGGTFAGSVTFFNGTTSVGTATLSGINASLTLTNLPFGADSLHAVYGGTTYYVSSTSTNVSENITADLAIMPGALSFASTAVGVSTASQAITLTNVGPSPITFTSATTVTGSGATSFIRANVNCVSPLPAGASCMNTVTFKPTSAGSLTAVVTYSDSGSPTPQTVSLIGTGTSSGPTLAISPGSLTFAPTAVGTTTAAQTITLTNTGTSPITFTSATTVTGSGATSYTRANVNCVSPLPAGATCMNTVTFKPTAAGVLTAVVTYSDSGSTTPQTVSLTGTGSSSGPVLAISPGSLTFASTAIGTTTAAQTISLTNTGTTPITFTSATTVTGSGATSFTRANVNCVSPLPAGATCMNTVTFKPTASGVLTATITYSDSGSTTPQTVSLTGTGAAAPTLSISPGSLTFASTAVGTATAAQTITLTNTGTTAITFTATTTVTGTGATSFTRANVNCVSPLAAGASCMNTVVFKPTVTGALAATVTYFDSGSTVPQTVALTGTGQ